MQTLMSEAATTLAKFSQYGLRYIWKLVWFSQKRSSSVFHKTLWNTKDHVFWSSMDVAKQKSCILSQCPDMNFFH